jgi:hypothetical protein
MYCVYYVLYNKTREPSKGPLSLSKFSVKEIFDKVFDETLIVTTVKEIFDQKL